MPAKQSNWFLKPKFCSHPALRLICFPYAGGSAASFLDWSNHLKTNVELIAIQPPGRGNRLIEKPFTDIHAMVNSLTNDLSQYLNLPYIFIGHSLGSKVAFEVCRKLQKINLPLPRHFIASASSSPDVAHTGASSKALTDSEFIAKLRELKGTPPQVLDNSELMELCMPSLRSDFHMSDEYVSTENARFDCGLSVFYGKNDTTVKVDELRGWSKYFTRNCNFTEFSGDHFFIDETPKLVAQAVNSIIETVIESDSNLRYRESERHRALRLS